MTTPQDVVAINKAADDLVSSVEWQYRLGLLAQGFSPDEALRLFLLGPLVSLSDFGKSSAQLALRKNMADLAPLIEKWQTTLRRWAAAGCRDDGSSYTWERWFEHGAKDLASAIQFYTGEVWDSSVAVNFLRAIRATGSDLSRCAADPLSCADKTMPGWLKALLVCAAGVAVVSFMARMR